jgi:SpoVK/Ycf46/Vps4 family AAA+-type ATPase
MNYVVNTESGKIYNVKSTARDDDPLSNTYQKTLMKLERLFDGFVPDGKISTTNLKYRELTQDELAKLTRIAPTLAPMGKVVTLEILNQVPAAPTAPASDDAPHADESEADDAATTQLESMLQANMPQVGSLVTPTERDTFDHIIVYDAVKNDLNDGLNLILGREEMDRDWGISEIEPMKGRCIMNFVGPPGVGKTASAKAVARAVNKKLYQVDYSQIISKWVGDTGKHIKAAFAAAKQNNAVLFFDEADSLMSKRIEMTDDAVSNSVNQNRNILMQELDKFDGIVLMASNFFQNYDEALLRRIAKHIHFELPDQGMRKKIFELPVHIPALTRAKFDNVDLDVLAKESKGLSGGDIKTVCFNAVMRAATARTGKITQDDYLTEIRKVLKNKAVHKGVSIGAVKGGNVRRPMGLHSNPEGESERD